MGVHMSVQLPTLRQLEYVVAVADLMHFGRAAKRCAVSQPALSKQVQEVEQLLGITLFERTRPQVQLTHKGKQIVAQARVVLSEARMLLQVATATRGMFQGQLHLGVIPTLSPYVLPLLWKEMRSLYAGLQTVLVEQKTYVLVEELRAGRLDLLLLALPVEASGLCVLPLYDEPFVFAAPKEHVLGVNKPVKEEILTDEPLLLLEEGHCLRDHALDVCTARGGGAGLLNIEASSVTTLMLMVEAGMGPTLLPASSLPVEWPKASDVVLRAFVSQTPPSRRVGLVWRPTSPRTELFQALGELLLRLMIGFDVGAKVPIAGTLQPFQKV